ncbi:MAG TPA: hypothetical protein VEB60_02060 [Candidatus Paceibacterota bacterium]|nr:hypothetical protein [Candidatus Paceibacterota bacterium]
MEKFPSSHEKPPAGPPPLPEPVPVPPPLPERPEMPETESSRQSRNIVRESKWARLAADKDIQEGLGALARTAANAGISLADLMPAGIGEIGSWGADALKWTNWILRGLGLIEKNIDLTPSVSKMTATGSEAFEFISLGLMPSHAIETLLQLKREDLPKIRKMIVRIKKILAEEQADYLNNKREIDDAMEAFNNHDDHE